MKRSFIYGGGCKKHTFSLKLGLCLETYPVQCSAQLIEKIEGGFDACEAIKFETVVFGLKKYKLNGPYFAGGTLRISGDKGMSGKPTTVEVVLP